MGLYGNEIADELAKEAAQEDSGEVIYNKIPRTHIIREAEEKGLQVAGPMGEDNQREFQQRVFPVVQDRLKQRMPLNGQITAILYGHGDNAGEMSPGSSTESYPAFARIGLRENPRKNLNQVTCPDRDSNPGHLVSRPDALTVTPQVWI
ncbi:hypothetical protein ANN_08106 [Periplaneta americana]|uniref:RNase H type-1 domain-containing protein n=1 Tax=Periplaneta americana TaxID=6978 RepID=A0ABQ8T0H3_PERAM|nr:hypothetical protein ANN_08106 [Periplaneta americana]